MKKKIAGISILAVIFLMATIGISFAAGDGAVATGNLSVFKNGKLARNLTGVNPVEEGPLLVCNGKCMIRSGGVAILAADKAELAIANRDGSFNLFVRSGHVEFTISPGARKMVFFTPDGAYSVADVMFNASTEPVVRGYMQVNDEGARVGVREGRMIFNTADGIKTVKPDQQIILAMADVDKKTAPIEAETKKEAKKRAAYAWWTGSSSQIAGAMVVSGAAVSGIVYAASHNSGGGHTRVPSQYK